MSTQIQMARDNMMTPEMQQVASGEGIDAEVIRERIAQGKIVIPRSIRRQSNIVGIGKGLRTKINASIGTSSDIKDIDLEVKKAKVAEATGADTLMELSAAGNFQEIRKAVLEATALPVGSVPLYQAFAQAVQRYGSAEKMPAEMIFDVIEEQCEDGISFMAIHCGINQVTLERLRKQGYRYGGIVSKGGALMNAWMVRNQKENPLYEHFDRVVEILRKYDAVLSLGNGYRAGAIHDSSDRVQIQELIINCELAEIGQDMGCQMMVEGPGHIPVDEIQANIILQKRMSNEAPFYVLGPLPTDVTPGYDHITAAVGASLASAYGADFICYVTPAEHLGLPMPDDVREGVMAAKVAAHIGDMVKLGRRERDLSMAKARRDLDWGRQFELAITGDTPRKIRASRQPECEESCTMCGDFCASHVVNEYFKEDLLKGKKASERREGKS